MGDLKRSIIILTGALILFYLFGFVQNTPNTALLNLILDYKNIQTSQLYTAAISATALALAGITTLAGLAQKNDLMFSVAITSILFTFLFDIISIAKAIAAVSWTFALVICSPLVIFYVLSVFEWWRGVAT